METIKSNIQGPFGRVFAEHQRLAEAITRSGKDTDEDELVGLTLNSVKQWAKANIDPFAIDAEGSIPAAVYRSAAELGLFGLTTPTEFGGAGTSLAAAARIIEEVTYYDGSLAACIGVHCGLGLQGLVRFGDDELRRLYLPSLATGERIAAFAATEPNAGSQISAVRTVGRWDGGGTLKVTGQKAFVTNGGVADVFTVFGRVPELGGTRRGHSLLLLRKDMPGVVIGAEENKLGIRGSSTTTVCFDEVDVPINHIIGEPSKGLTYLAEVLAWGRALVAAGCLGSARAAYDQTVVYVLERRQFGHPIGSFGQIREKIARMRALLYATEAVVRLTCQLHTLCAPIGVWESATSKVFASENVWKIADSAVQLHGGIGFIEETGLARILRDCRSTRIFEGASETVRLRIASGALDFAEELQSLPELHSIVPEDLKHLAVSFDQRRVKLGSCLLELRARYGIRVSKHQIQLTAAADAAMDLFALLATLVRAVGENNNGRPAESSEHLKNIARYAAALLTSRIDLSLARACGATDEPLIHLVSSGEYALTEATGGRRLSRPARRKQ